MATGNNKYKKWSQKWMTEVGGGKIILEVRELRGSVFDGLLPGCENHQG